MHFTLATVLAVLPLLTVASPTLQQPRTKIALNKRSNIVKPDGTVNTEALRAQLAHTANKIAHGFEAYERNTGSRHPLAPTGNAKRDKSGKDPLTDDSEQLWYGEISVGTPPTTYKVDFDTGSSDLFLPGPGCSQGCSGHKTYDPKSSSTSKDVGKTFKLGYGDGSAVTGEQYTDTVSIAGLTATGQTLGAAKTYTDGFNSTNFPADGLMGMAFQKISDYKASPLFQSLVAQGQTSKPVFGFKLAKSGSELSVGDVDSSMFSGDITYAKVTEEGYWQVALDAVTVGGQPAVSSVDSIIDTGTSLVLGPQADIDKFYQAIPGSQAASNGLYTFPCNSIPKVSLTFNGKSFDISGDSFNLGPADQSGSNCVGGVGVVPDPKINFWIVGDVFLENTYTVFDVGNSQVGFAKLT